MPHADQVLVTIAVQNRKLSIYPQRSEDVAIFCNSRNPQAPPQSPAKPREVCWMATGRNADQAIQIRSKTRGDSPFSMETWEIPGKEGDFAESGPVRTGPAQGQIRAWHYGVFLVEDGRTVDYIDPTVVIKTDP